MGIRRTSRKGSEDVKGIDEALDKVERLVIILKEAKSFADDLASMDLQNTLCSITKGMKVDHSLLEK